MESVVADVEKFEGREGENDGGEFAGEVIVTDIELEEEGEAPEGIRKAAAETVGVDVEQSKVGQEAEVLRQGAGDVRVVEVDSSDGEDVGVIGGGGAVDAGIVADVGAVPVGGEVGGVGGHGAFPSLESGVGFEESRVREKRRRWQWGWRRGRRGLLIGRFGEEGNDGEEEEPFWERGV